MISLCKTLCFFWVAALASSALRFADASANQQSTAGSVFFRAPWKSYKLNLSRGRRDGYLLVPGTYWPPNPSPLLVLLHEASGSSNSKALAALASQEPLLSQQRCLILLPESQGRTWDIVMNGEFGPDARYLSAAAQRVLRTYKVNPSRIALVGFSDGATYALSLGLPLGRVFHHIVAFSPGDMAPPSVSGQPQVFVSHGVKDDVLAIDKASRRIMPRLKSLLPEKGQLQYIEFQGKHEVPPAVVSKALKWFFQ